MELLYSALILGLMGSFHCMGMCGPIALSLPFAGSDRGSKLLSALLYNLGRTLGYGSMGLLFGLIGQGFQLLGFQRWISIAMGLLMVISIMGPLWMKKNASGKPNRWLGFIRNSIQKLFKQKSFSGLFLIGILNSFLPCGLVYLAIAGAIGMGNATYGMLYMILFGLGTIPMMFSIAFLGNMLSISVRKSLNKIIPYVVVFIGIIFIFRGLCLGIPYLSPPLAKLNPAAQMNTQAPVHSSQKVEESCCHKH